MATRIEMLKDLLVHVDPSDSGRARVRFAVALATRLDASLTGLHVVPSAEVPPVYKPSQVEEARTQLEFTLGQDASAAAAMFIRETADSAGARWHGMHGDVVDAMCHRAN
jgi:nucleotide-binding universal stress UspA family protein